MNFGDMMEISQAHGGVEFRIFAIDPQFSKCLRTMESEIPDIGQFFEQRSILGNYQPAFTGMVKLGRMEATGGNVTVFKNRSAVYLYPEGMCRIIDDFKAVFFGNFVNGFYIAGITKNMGSQNSRGMGGNGGFNFLWVNIKRLPIYI